MVDILLGVLLQGLGLVKVANPLTPFHQDFGITRAIDNLHSILISLSTFDHISLELWLWDTIPGHHMINVLLENYLSIHILKLEVVTCNGHDVLVGPIVNMACHGGPTGDTLDMVKHNPCILQVTTSLHLPNQVDTALWTNL